MKLKVTSLVIKLSYRRNHAVEGNDVTKLY